GTSSFTADQGSSGIPVTFTVLDAGGNPESGALLDGTTTLADGTVPSTATTGSNGKVTVTLHDIAAGDAGAVTGTVHGTSIRGSTGTVSIIPGALASLVV